jgi:Ca2+-binding RTX toxin-like protein
MAQTFTFKAAAGDATGWRYDLASGALSPVPATLPETHYGPLELNLGVLGLGGADQNPMDVDPADLQSITAGDYRLYGDLVVKREGTATQVVPIVGLIWLVDYTDSVDMAASTLRQIGPVDGSVDHFTIDFGGSRAYSDLVGKTLGQMVKNGDTIVGSSFADTLKTTNMLEIVRAGNGNDTIESRGGDDEIYGGGGNDSLDGGAGNDGLAGEAGADLIYGRAGADTLVGGAGNDVMHGGDGNDVLNGGLGFDILTGGLHKDIFVFNVKVARANADIIVDFNPVNDTIALDNAVFTKIGANGALRASAFKLSTQALDANDRIIYNASNGGLFYDQDGSGSAAAILIALLKNKAAITASDFIVI